MNCPSCRAALDAGVRFCTRCGAPITRTAAGEAFLEGRGEGPPAAGAAGAAAAGGAGAAGGGPALPEADPNLGRVLDGRYRLLRGIGRGGFGAVYQAEQLSMGRRVAVKLLHAELVREPQVVARFAREAQATCDLRDPHTLVTHDFSRDGDQLFIVTELLRGRPLAEALEAEGAIGAERAVRIAAQVCESLAEAHDHGVVHRDIKPENIFLEERAGEREFVKVLDFGIAKIVAGEGEERNQLTEAGQTIGTVEYMSPEQLRGQRLDGRSDLYAVGVLAYRMITGRLPFTGRTVGTIIAGHLSGEAARPSQAAPSCPPAIERVILECLAKDRRARPAGARELRARLLDSLDAAGAAPAQGAPASGTVAASGTEPAARARDVVGTVPPSFDLGPAAAGPGEALVGGDEDGTLKDALDGGRRGRAAVVGALVAVALAGAGAWLWHSRAGDAARRAASPGAAPAGPAAAAGAPDAADAGALIAIVPAAMDGAVSIDLAALRASPLGPAHDRVLPAGARAQAEALAGALGLVPATIDRVAVGWSGVTPSPAAPDLPDPRSTPRPFLVAVQGRFDREGSGASLRQALGGSGGPHREDGIEYLHGRNAHFGFLPGGALFVAGGDTLDGVLAVAGGRDGSLADRADAAFLLRRAGWRAGEAYAAVGHLRVGAGEGEAAARRLGARGPLAAAAFTVALPDGGARLRVALRGRDPKTASDLCSLPASAHRAAAGLPDALDASLDRATLRAAGDVCELDVPVATDRLAELAARL